MSSAYIFIAVTVVSTICFSEGKTCYLLSFTDSAGCMKWTIPETDVLQCNQLLLGGRRDSTDKKNMLTFDKPYFSSNEESVRNFLCGKVQANICNVNGIDESSAYTKKDTLTTFPTPQGFDSSSLKTSAGTMPEAQETTTHIPSSQRTQTSSTLGAMSEAQETMTHIPSSQRTQTSSTLGAMSEAQETMTHIPSSQTSSTLDGTMHLCPSNLEELICTCEVLLQNNVSSMCSCSEPVGLNVLEGSTCAWLPRDCDEILQNDVTEDGLYTIYPSGNDTSPFNVYCHMTNDEGWTVIQRRLNGAVNFNQERKTYVEGFGNLNEEFWLGNEKLFRLTNQSIYTLQIDMVFDGGLEVSAQYDAFRINDATDDFRLVSLGSFNSSFEGFDAMALGLNMGFTTLDHDVDTHSENCASRSGGGWWYEGGSTGWCYHANLNGIHGDLPNQKAIIWYIGSGFQYEYLVNYVEMKLRPT